MLFRFASFQPKTKSVRI